MIIQTLNALTCSRERHMSGGYTTSTTDVKSRSEYSISNEQVRMGPTPTVLDNIQTSLRPRCRLHHPWQGQWITHHRQLRNIHLLSILLISTASSRFRHGKPCRQLAMTIQTPLSIMRPTSILPLHGMAKRRAAGRFVSLSAIDEFEMFYSDGFSYHWAGKYASVVHVGALWCDVLWLLCLVRLIDKPTDR